MKSVSYLIRMRGNLIRMRSISYLSVADLPYIALLILMSSFSDVVMAFEPQAVPEVVVVDVRVRDGDQAIELELGRLGSYLLDSLCSRKILFLSDYTVSLSPLTGKSPSLKTSFEDGDECGKFLNILMSASSDPVTIKFGTSSLTPALQILKRGKLWEELWLSDYELPF